MPTELQRKREQRREQVKDYWLFIEQWKLELIKNRAEFIALAYQMGYDDMRILSDLKSIGHKVGLSELKRPPKRKYTRLTA